MIKVSTFQIQSFLEAPHWCWRRCCRPWLPWKRWRGSFQLVKNWLRSPSWGSHCSTYHWENKHTATCGSWGKKLCYCICDQGCHRSGSAGYWGGDSSSKMEKPDITSCIFLFNNMILIEVENYFSPGTRWYSTWCSRLWINWKIGSDSSYLDTLLGPRFTYKHLHTS